MRSFIEDLRFGLRLLQSSPGYTAVTVLTLALGIAASTTVFSWLDSVVVHPIPGAADGQRLVMLEGVSSSGSLQMSYLDYKDYRDGLKLIDGVAGERPDVMILGDGSGAQPVWGEVVTPEFFQVLGVQPILGRAFDSGEKPDPSVVISERLWRNTYASDPQIIGKSIRVNRHDFVVIGVAPSDFRGIQPGIVYNLWIPISMGKEIGMFDDGTFRNRGSRNQQVIARLKAGVTVQQATAEAVALSARLAATYPRTNRGTSALMIPVGEAHNGAPELLAAPLKVLMAVCGVVFLIVCANVSNLLLARALARSREFGIRIALGSGRFRLLRQLLTESMLVSVAGAMCGFLISLWMADGLMYFIPRIGIPVALSGLQVNTRISLFAVAACCLSAILAGAAPALLAARSDVNETLKQGGRTGTSAAKSTRMRSALIISEVALAALALVGAGLFFRSFQNARNIAPGFDKNSVLLSRFYVATGGYKEPELQHFALRLRERLQSATGVETVTYADTVPLGATAGPWQDIQVEGYQPAPGEDMKIFRSSVSPGYFATLKIPLLEGRDFTNADDRTKPGVVIVNETFARRFFGGSPAIGRKVRGWGRWLTVIGVARDSRQYSLVGKMRPHFYAPFQQTYNEGLSLYFFVRTAGDPNALAPVLRREVLGVDPTATAYHALPLAEYTEVTMIPHKIAAGLISVMGLISLVLAGVGLYSVMAYSVTQRTQEIGIRMALGAGSGDVIRSILFQGMKWTGVGLAAGAVLAWVSTRLVGSMLVNVSASDPLAFLSAGLFLGTVSLLATYIPARRATKVDPIRGAAL